ncbi:hypothetical protein ACOSQ4_004028 [Xanthoceras sorbifolium]
MVEHPIEGGLPAQSHKLMQLYAPEVTPSSLDWTLRLVASEFLDQVSTLSEDFPTKGLSWRIEEAYKEELIAKAKLEKELAKKAHRCQAFRKELELEMNASAANYKDHICKLKQLSQACWALSIFLGHWA